MDEEVTIIDTNTRNEKIINFFIKNKKKLIIFLSLILIILIGYFSFDNIKERNRIKLSNKFNSAIADYNSKNITKTTEVLINIVNKKDTTYSPLALYFLIDNNLIKNREEINSLFEVLINERSFKKEIRNLIIYKKALLNSNDISGNELILILGPIINSESIWKSHALYLMAEFFYSKNEKNKAKEFFNKILILPNSNNDIKLMSKKRINRDFGE